ncbi:hypothetical protein Tco_0011519 [Tanacetum coccineum]
MLESKAYMTYHAYANGEYDSKTKSTKRKLILIHLPNDEQISWKSSEEEDDDEVNVSKDNDDDGNDDDDVDKDDEMYDEISR